MFKARMYSCLFALQVGSVSYDRQPIADHAQNLASTIKSNLQKSLEAIGVVRPPLADLPNSEPK